MLVQLYISQAKLNEDNFITVHYVNMPVTEWRRLKIRRDEKAALGPPHAGY